jgi:hypothetical protein
MLIALMMRLIANSPLNVNPKRRAIYRIAQAAHRLAQEQELTASRREAGSRRGLGTVKNQNWMERLLARTLFPRAQDIPQPFAVAFMRMMMAHARFELGVRALQGVVADDPYYGEKPGNLWSADKRPKLMVKLINEKLGPIQETEPIKKLLREACDPTDKRNHLAHGTWWAFDAKTATIQVRGGIQRKDKDQFGEYSEAAILDIAERFEALEADLYKLRSNIENRRGGHSFDWSSPP